MRPDLIITGSITFLIGIACGYLLAIGKLFHDARDLMEDIALSTSGETPDLQVQVMAKQFSWHFHYPGSDGKFGSTDIERISSSNPLGLDFSDPASADDFHTRELVLPCNRGVELLITSADVIHCLSILDADLQQDAIPGRYLSSYLKTSTSPRSGRLRCVQLCGEGHDNHHAPYRFILESAFSAWASQQAIDNAEQVGASNSPPAE